MFGEIDQGFGGPETQAGHGLTAKRWQSKVVPGRDDNSRPSKARGQ